MENLQNVEARRFWQNDFDNYRADEFSPPKNKLSKLLVGGTVSLMLSQGDSAINFRNIMDDGMIFLGNLSKVGSEVREILGSFMLSVIHSTALSRTDIPIEQRKLFHVYLDEAHRFHTDSLEDIITETRKYNVGLTLAHQYMKQFESRKAGALSSVGTTVTFNIDSKDAAYLAKDFQNLVSVEDVVKLKEREGFVRCGSEIVKIRTIEAPRTPPRHFRDEIIALSRKKYYLPVAQVQRTVERRGERLYKPYSPLVPDADKGLPEEFTYEQY
ncbi:MAG: type IV secretory system conjugative DNA transfer family protein [Planctomycetes bacterium]|nr:type IV secretory system conjugative DNA transfer family protein [Planctomycetota bacterium]